MVFKVPISTKKDLYKGYQMRKKTPKMPEQEIMEMLHKKRQTFPKTHDWQPLMYK